MVAKKKLPWVKQRIDAFYGSSPTKRLPVEAQCLGSLAYHKNLCDRPIVGERYTITHIPTGLVVSGVRRTADAKKLIEALYTNQTYRDAFAKKTNGEVIRSLPPHFNRWLRQMCYGNGGKYIPEEEFMQREQAGN